MVVLLFIASLIFCLFLQLFPFNIHKSDVVEQHWLASTFLGAKEMMMKYWDDNLIINRVFSCVDAFSNSMINNHTVSESRFLGIAFNSLWRETLMKSTCLQSFINEIASLWMPHVHV